MHQRFSKTAIFIFCSPLLLLLAFSPLARGVDAAHTTSALTFESLFEEGLKQAQSQKWNEARSAFRQAVQIQPDNAALWTNMGLVEYHLGEKGWAVALLRRALTLDPGQSTAKVGLDFILPELEVREIPHEIRWNETLHQQLLAGTSNFSWSVMTALLFLAFGWTWLQFAHQRRQSLAADKVLPTVPFLGVLFGFLLVASAALFVLKLLDVRQARGTVLPAKVSALSSPDANAPSLFELFAGLEVLIENSQTPQWLQVTYPGGSTGWVTASSVFLTTEASPLPPSPEAPPHD
jgi:tetratricopeptide (TPR) repeat protein